jgi:hypothetical protein
MPPLRTTRFLARLAPVAAVLALGALAPAGAWADNVVSPSHITGTVTSSTGGAVPGVTVYAFQPGTSNYSNPPVTTGASGTYTLTLAAGSWDIEFVPGGLVANLFQAQWYNGVQVPLGNQGASTAAPPAGVTAVSVGPAATASNINATLFALGGISGRATTSDGKGVGGVTVTLLDPKHPTNAGVATTTDGSGRYALAGVAPGSYLVEFITTNPSPQTLYWKQAQTVADASTVTIGSAQVVAQVNVTLAGGVLVNGTIRALSGRKLVARGGVVSYKIGCHQAPSCKITADAYAILGGGSTDIAHLTKNVVPGNTANLKLRLSNAARHALKKHSLAVKLIVISGSVTLTRNIVVRG